MTGIKTRPESLPIGALLTSVGGFLDAYTFVGHRVFANAQTGNVVLFGVSAASRQWHAALLRLLPILAFLLGVLAVEVLGTPRVRAAARRPVRVALVIQIGLLAVVAALPASAPALVTTVSVSFVAAVQFHTFRLLGDAPYTTLMATGNMRSGVAAAFQWLVIRDAAAGRRAGRFGAVVGAFAVGAIVGALCTQQLGAPAAGVAAGVLIVAAGLLIRDTRRRERREATAESPGGPAAQAGAITPTELTSVRASEHTEPPRPPTGSGG